jgi:hypothetical protein
MIRSQPAIPERVPVLTFPTPRGKADLVFFERRDSRLSKNQSWCYGDEHPNKREYPDHELVLVSPDDGDPAWQRWYYAAVREKQHLYNWTATDEPDWPALTQVFFVKRCSLPVDEDSLLPPPVEFVDTTDYLVTGTEIGRAGDDLLESLYVTVKLTREHLLNNPKVSYVLDAQTNTLRPVVEEKIPASQAEAEASTVDANGQYSEVRAATSRWAIKTTQFMEGLAGGVAGGGHVQEWTDVLNYSWPYVFRGCSFNVFPSSSGGIAKLTVTPRWLRERYDGPCEATIREEWTFTEPTPPILQPMLTTGMEFNGGLLQVNIPPCLHPFWYFIDSPGTDHPEFGYYQYYEEYPATTLQDWPEEHIASFTVRPAMGGYISRTVTVKRPSGGVVFANLVTLLAPVVGATAGTVNLSWTHENLYGTLVRYKLSVNRKADFTGTYLTGFNNKNVGTATTATVTGLQIGIIYFARVDAYVLIDDEEQMVSSNTQALSVPLTVKYSVAVDGSVVPDGYTLDYGTVSSSFLYPASRTISIVNTGNSTITGVTATLSGTDSAMWSTTAISDVTLTPGETATFDLQFAPTSATDFAAELTLGFTNAPAFSMILEGAAGAPTCDVTVDTLPVDDGDTLTFDGDMLSALVTVSNNGVGNLTIYGATVDSPWEFSSPFFDPITVLPGDFTNFTVNYLPTTSGSDTGTLEFTTDAPVSVFSLNLAGTAAVAPLQLEHPVNNPVTSHSIVFYASIAEMGTTLTSASFFIRALSGALPLTVTPAINGAGSSSFSLTELPSPAGEDGVIEGGEYQEYRVDCLVPTTPGSYTTAQLDFTHNDPTTTSPAGVSLEVYVASY